MSRAGSLKRSPMGSSFGESYRFADVNEGADTVYLCGRRVICPRPDLVLRQSLPGHEHEPKRTHDLAWRPVPVQRSMHC